MGEGRRSLRGRGVAVAAGLLLTALGLRCIRGDELQCENAVTRLADCCPTFPRIEGYCDYSEGCGTYYPTISESDARCIARSSCEDLVASGVCDRAATAPRPSEGNPGPDLCP